MSDPSGASSSRRVLAADEVPGTVPEPKRTVHTSGKTLSRSRGCWDMAGAKHFGETVTIRDCCASCEQAPVLREAGEDGSDVALGVVRVR
jgi:hypothetical protein